MGGYFEDQSKHTLDNMLEKLQKYPKMKFVWAETVFLDLWWRDLDKFQRGMNILHCTWLTKETNNSEGQTG